jgi:hypothetical protein
MAAYAVATVVFGLLWVLGLPAAALWRLSHDGLTPGTALLGVVGLGWLAMVVYALLTDAETRGWILFFLFGWLLAIPALLRAVAGAARALRR